MYVWTWRGTTLDVSRITELLPATAVTWALRAQVERKCEYELPGAPRRWEPQKSNTESMWRAKVFARLGAQKMLPLAARHATPATWYSGEAGRFQGMTGESAEDTGCHTHTHTYVK